jgi:lipid A 3-O-deacylase
MSVRLPKCFLALLAAAMLVQGTLLFASESGQELTFRFENDCFGGTDEHYSHGAKLTWALPPFSVIHGAVLPEERLSGARQYAFSLGQAVYTPKDVKRETVILDDRPYAGWTYLSAALRIDDRKRQDVLELQLGIVGPAAHAKEIQDIVHRWLGYGQSNGWSNQLNNEPGLLLAWERTWRIVLDERLHFLPHVSLALGNVETSTGVGAEIRTGPHLHEDFGGELIRPARLDKGGGGKNGSGVFLFLGAEGRAVAHTIFLDGNTFSTSPSVDKRNLAGDLYGGIGIVLGRTAISYTHVYRSEEFKGQDGGQWFGSVRVGWSF